MGVGIDEAGRGEKPVGVDGFGGRLVDRPNGDDAAVLDADVADERRRTAPVDDASAPNTEIKHHVHLVLDYVRQYITGRVPPKSRTRLRNGCPVRKRWRFSQNRS